MGEDQKVVSCDAGRPATDLRRQTTVSQATDNSN